MRPARLPLKTMAIALFKSGIAKTQNQTIIATRF
jgi:hypothetical protein